MKTNPFKMIGPYIGVISYLLILYYLGFGGKAEYPIASILIAIPGLLGYGFAYITSFIGLCSDYGCITPLLIGVLIGSVAFGFIAGWLIQLLIRKVRK